MLPPLNLSSNFSSPQKIGGVKAGNEAVVQTLLDQVFDGLFLCVVKLCIFEVLLLILCCYFTARFSLNS